VQIRETLKWIIVIGAEEFVRNLIPHLLPVYLLIVLVYVTWQFLEFQPVRTGLQSAYSSLRPRQKMSSYLMVFVIGGLLLCFYWWAINKTLVAIGHPVSDHSTTAASTTSPQASAIPSSNISINNVDDYVKQWVHEFPENFDGGIWQEAPPEPEVYFGYYLIFKDRHGIGVSRPKDSRFAHIIRLAWALTLDDQSVADYSNLSPEQKRNFTRELTIETSRAKMHVDFDDPIRTIKMVDDLPINTLLSKDSFYVAVQDMHSKVLLVHATVDRLFHEIRSATSATSTPTARDLDTAELAITTKCQEAIIINKYKNRTIFSKDLESTDYPNYLGDFHELIQRGIIQYNPRFASRPLSESERPPDAPAEDQFEQFSQCFITQNGKRLAEDLLYLREHPEISVSRPMEPQPDFIKRPSPTPDKGASPH
jgi:hypothetical protein